MYVKKEPSVWHSGNDDHSRCSHSSLNIFFVYAQVLMKGYMTNHADPKALNCIGNWYKPWFFTHVASFLKSGA